MNRFLIIVFLGITLLNSCKSKKEEAVDQSYNYSVFAESLLKEEFDLLATSLVAEKISTQNYLDWTYDFQTRNEDGPRLIEKFENAIFTKANEDEHYLEKISIFFSDWDGAAELFQQHEHPGAVKIATTILTGSN